MVAWNVRRLRVERGLAQEALAADAGVDRTWIGELERGTGNPTVTVLQRVADGLGVHISKLFEEPLPGSERPVPLRGGRKPRASKPPR